MTNKKEIRSAIRKKIQQMTAAQRDTASLYICLRILGTREWQEARGVMLYQALPDEVNLDILIDDARLSHKYLLLPDASPQAPLPSPTDLQQIDLALIPGRAFTSQGDRLGRGGGWYDRLLPLLHGSVWGAAFDCQLLPSLPTDPWDIPVHKVVTP